MKLTTRFAESSDGETIKKLVCQDAHPFFDELDWSTVGPDWILIEKDGSVVGCIQVCLGRPIARIEHLATKPGLSDREKPPVVKKLLLQALAALTLHGAQVGSGMVRFEDKGYKRFLKKRGAIVVASGNIVMKRVF